MVELNKKFNLPSPMKHTANHKAPRQDWLHFSAAFNISTSTIYSPPGPISDPLEPKHDPDSLLSEYSDEEAWSESITRWSREHPLGV
jgi:hypothetical protein